MVLAYDGLSIAWAVIEHLHGIGANGPRTLFATHYHELTRLRDSLPRLHNYCVAVKEWNDEIIFIRQVIAGAAEDRSYGIQVARLRDCRTQFWRALKIFWTNLKMAPKKPNQRSRKQ